MNRFSICLFLAAGLLSADAYAQQSIESISRPSLLFHASFDRAADADFAKGDAKIYTANSLKRETVVDGLKSDVVEIDTKNGRFGGSLRFTRKSPKLVFFKAAKNVPQTGKGFAGTFSFWLQTNAEKDLPFDYVDPFQVTDKAWNNSSFFVDFDKIRPRVFRLGAFSEIKFWNPDNRPWDKVEKKDRPMVAVNKLPFGSDKWTHVAIVFLDFNSSKDGTAELFLDGKSQGKLVRPQQFKWDPAKTVIMLGINYVGGLDELSIFDRPLSVKEVQELQSRSVWKSSEKKE